MTNIDLNSIEYHSSLAGLQNTGSFDFSFAVPAKALAAHPDNAAIGPYDVTIETIELTNRIIDIQLTMPGLDERRYYMGTSFRAFYDQSGNYITNRGAVPGNYWEFNIIPAIKGKNLRFFITLINYDNAIFNTPAFTVKGTVVFFEAPFKIA